MLCVVRTMLVRQRKLERLVGSCRAEKRVGDPVRLRINLHKKTGVRVSTVSVSVCPEPVLTNA